MKRFISLLLLWLSLVISAQTAEDASVSEPCFKTEPALPNSSVNYFNFNTSDWLADDESTVKTSGANKRPTSFRIYILKKWELFPSFQKMNKLNCNK